MTDCSFEITPAENPLCMARSRENIQSIMNINYWLILIFTFLYSLNSILDTPITINYLSSNFVISFSGLHFVHARNF